jgi:serine/threonine-protein kinase RsbW
MVIKALEIVEPSKPRVLTSSSPAIELPLSHLDIPRRDNGNDHRIIATHPERIVQNEGLLMPRENVELFLPSRLGFEKIARNAAGALATEMGFSPDRIEDLKTAVAEACMNAIEHGNLEDRATSVNVLLSASQDHIEVRIEDRGRQHIPNPLPPPGGVDKSRGWGLFFIQNLMDEVEITKLPEGGNIVKMTIYLGPEEPSDDDFVPDEPSADASEWIEQNE